MNKKASFIIPTVIIKAANQEIADSNNSWGNEMGNRSDRIIELLKEKPDFIEKILMLPSDQRDSGRYAGLAEYADEPANLTVKYPNTSRALATGIGGLTGAALGALAGSKLTTNPENTAVNTLSGGAIGTTAGALIGAFIDTMLRSKEKKRLAPRLEIAPFFGENGTWNIKDPNLLASLVSGSHQQGKADAAEIAAGMTPEKSNMNMRNIGSVIAPSLYPAVSLYDYSEAKRRIRNAKKKELEDLEN